MIYPRTLTIVLNIPKAEDLILAKWIWADHLKPDPNKGIIINRIANGDAIEKNDELEKALASTKDTRTWYAEAREFKIKELELKVADLEKQLISKNEVICD
jgi:hypothetical protein